MADSANSHVTEAANAAADHLAAGASAAADHAADGGHGMQDYIIHHLTNLTYGQHADGTWGFAHSIEEAGAIGLEIEAMPYAVGKAVDEAVSIFTFSIGAGAAGTCQLLNGYDLIGSFDTFKPKFAKRYGNVNEVAVKAFEDYAADVRSGAFPDDDHTYKMNAEEARKLREALEADQ